MAVLWLSLEHDVLVTKPGRCVMEVQVAVLPPRPTMQGGVEMQCVVKY